MPGLCSACLFRPYVSTARRLRVPWSLKSNGTDVEFGNLVDVLAEPGTQLRVFGKPEVCGHRRMGVILSTADSVDEARAKAEAMLMPSSLLKCADIIYTIH